MHSRADVIQMNLDRLEEWTDRNLRKFSKNIWKNFCPGHLHLYKFIELNETTTHVQNSTMLYSYA